MYTRESATRRIKAMGAYSFIEWLSSSKFSIDELEQLEAAHLFKDGVLCEPEIYRLAAQ